ncbi:MAG: hypothetical protein DRR16_11765 [Candidatus Parabeggiatoa sp. nov. 3]|nr:MAG: hypothetical protein DRR00_11150 [Gammaproteobacteria bacterium]RKZ65916.1 MAG: hypothetical protein DRQ99_11250 [Gammaproteobacteria bacterium]RKZ85557.1 MAG: hypothetical protein DRR16_11765 [Gammaproteobacteria bacterium]
MKLLFLAKNLTGFENLSGLGQSRSCSPKLSRFKFLLKNLMLENLMPLHGSSFFLPQKKGGKNSRLISIAFIPI